MFFILVIFTAFVTILFQYSADRNISNPLTSFNITWFLAVLFSKINMSNLYVINDNTYLYIWIGQITFNAVIFVYTKGNFVNFKMDSKTNISLNNLRSKIFHINILQFVL